MKTYEPRYRGSIQCSYCGMYLYGESYYFDPKTARITCKDCYGVNDLPMKSSEVPE